MLTYKLPQELIAQRPVEPRDSARLLVLYRFNGEISHRVFRDLSHFLRPGDCLVLNDTRLIPARLRGKRLDTGGKVELLLLSPHPSPLPQGEKGGLWRCLGQPGHRLQVGAQLSFNHGSLQAEVIAAEGAERLVQFEQDPIDSGLGEVPLPPYIRRAALPEDAQWYQTVYARQPGAVAAPTAGLHFTRELLDRIRAMGIRIAFVTLHVGWGTFKLVGKEELKDGRLHEEWFQIPSETTDLIASTKRKGGRVVAVGTTVVRALETFFLGARLKPGTPLTTNLFIRPGFRFQAVDALITNFHLPGTSLLYLVAAFAGQEEAQAAYQEAIRQRYRFYSYGDAMLIQ